MLPTSVPLVPSAPSVPSKPLHLAIIPDGNRRWAKTNSLHPWKGHEKAVENFRTIGDWCREHHRIGTLTVWCFSTENWKRDANEVEKLMMLLKTYIQRERKDILKQHTRFVHSGRKDRIPPSLAKLLSEIEEETKDQTKFTLHLALDYGGKDEIIRAWKKSCETCRLCHPSTSLRTGGEGFFEEKSSRTITGGTPQDDTDDPIRPFLDHPELPDIDIIVRTSGEYRTSNFFLWQSTYAEWFFLDKHFPDLTVGDLEKVIQEFDERQRRFGS